MTTTEGTGGRASANKNCPQGRTFEIFFQMPGSLPGGMLAAGTDSHITLVKGRTFANLATHPQGNYSKIPIISPGAYFLSKGLFEKNFLGGGGDGLY